MGKHGRSEAQPADLIAVVREDRRFLAVVAVLVVAGLIFGGSRLLNDDDASAREIATQAAGDSTPQPPTDDRRVATAPPTATDPAPGAPSETAPEVAPDGDCGLEVARAAEEAVDASTSAMGVWRSHILAQDALDAGMITFAEAEAEWTRTRVEAPPTLEAAAEATGRYDDLAANCSSEPPPECLDRLRAADATLNVAKPNLQQWQVHLDDIAQSKMAGHSRMMGWDEVWTTAKPGLAAWDENVPLWTSTTSCV